MHHITDRLKQVIIFITNFKQQFVRLHVSFIIIATHVNFCNIFFSPKNKSGIEKLKLIRAQVFSFPGSVRKSVRIRKFLSLYPGVLLFSTNFANSVICCSILCRSFFFDKLAFSKSNALLQNFSNPITTGPLHRTTTRRPHAAALLAASTCSSSLPCVRS